MYLAAGIILLIVSLIIFCVIVFTAVRSVKSRGELVISKKNLVYLAPTFMLIYFLHMSAWIYKGVELNFFNCFALLGSALEVITKFKVDTDMVLPICSAYPVYYAAFIFAYIAGAAAVMPLGAPIGTNRGLRTKEMIGILIDELDVPIVVDAGIGRPSQACEAMEMGAAACLVNTAIASSADPVRMAAAFRAAVEAGRNAWLAGAGAVKAPGEAAEASSPLTGFLR